MSLSCRGVRVALQSVCVRSSTQSQLRQNMIQLTQLMDELTISRWINVPSPKKKTSSNSGEKKSEGENTRPLFSLSICQAGCETLETDGRAFSKGLHLAPSHRHSTLRNGPKRRVSTRSRTRTQHTRSVVTTRHETHTQPRTT